MSGITKRVKHIVTDGDFSFVTTGTPIYTVLQKGNKVYKNYGGIAPKQPVIWKDTTDGSVPVAIAPASLTANDLLDLHIGVGFDMTGNGVSDGIREIGPDEIKGCRITELGANAPVCPAPEIKALYPSCLTCEPLSVRVRWDDNFTRGYGPLNRSYQELVVTHTPDCYTCDDCPTVPTCDEFMCSIVDGINGELDLSILGESYPDWKGDTRERPIRAVKLHDNWVSYCIVPIDGADCKECNSVAALTDYTVDSVVYSFDNITDPADVTKTLLSQLEYAADQLEQKIIEVHGKHGGFVEVSRGQGDCCGIQLHIVTCDATVAIAGLTPCAGAIDQFPDFIENGVCQECGTVGTTVTPSCGFAVIAKQDVDACGGYLNQPKMYTGRTLQVDIIDGEMPVARNFKKATLQEGVLASGFGSQVQFEEYKQLSGGAMREYNDGNPHNGWLGIPAKDSRLEQAITANCKTSYCQYYVGHNYQITFDQVNNGPVQPAYGFIWVPEGDTTTKAEVEVLISQIATLSPAPCQILTTVTC